VGLARKTPSAATRGVEPCGKPRELQAIRLADTATREDGAVRLLRAVAMAAPDKPNRDASSARIPWRIIEQIRAALAAIDES